MGLTLRHEVQAFGDRLHLAAAKALEGDPTHVSSERHKQQGEHHCSKLPLPIEVCNWATAKGLLFFPIAASRLSGDPIGAGATERLEVVGSCRFNSPA
ncbi:hypothetical protein [Sphingomonas sp. GC_Shp_3]|uniref:hypothetical protein n=1 Tax=Sphingomonas sp. GC_Shp_3 TaxID=2937383 RepID=UPI00226A9369|nr:hypothetical protein [Sphingomonas sp. GC_Shp_3]